MKAQIKEWLTGAGRTRVWLAEQCGVRTKTVQNWLCSQQEIPVRTQNLIRQLMADDARSEAERRADQRADLPGRQGLQSHRLRQHLRLLPRRHHLQVAGNPLRQVRSSHGPPGPRPPLSLLPFHGTVAAGLPAGPTDTPAGEIPGPGYPAGRLRP